jgi:raffinose/stachyose/melibiose transport system permease protein
VKKKKKRRINIAFYIMTLPMAILFFIFHTYSFLKGVFYSFTNWQGFGEWDFVGLRNYLQMFKDNKITDSYIFTFKFAVCATILVNVLSLLLACGLNAKIKWKNTIKAIYFLPYMLGNLIIGYIFNYIFMKLLPVVGSELGIKALSVNILGTKNAWYGILFVTVWQSLAFNSMIYLAGLQTVDRDLYEAADLDGATGWKRFTKITFPLIAPFFTINMVLCVKGFLQAFDQIMSLTGGGPGFLTTSISLLIYRRGFQGGQFAYQSANAVVLFIVVASVSLFQLRVLEKREEKINS